MEIIQQKLIWVMGIGATLILLYKMKLGRAGMRRAPLMRLRAGAILLAWGGLLGIVSRTFFQGTGFTSSGWLFFLETIVGYTAGWVLIVWGLVSWAVSYFDLRGKPLTTAGSRIISDVILKSLTRGDSTNLTFNSLAKDLCSLLDCHAVTLHRIDENNLLRLAFYKGLSEASAQLIEFPRGDRNVFLTAEKSRQAVISDESHTIHDYSFCETAKGVVAASISIPVTYNGQLFGVLSSFRAKKIPFNDDDLKVLEVAASGLGASLRKEKADKDYHQETRFKELLKVAARPLENGQPMISAMIKSAKIINDYLPFKTVCLYILGDGAPRSYEFNLPTGGLVKVIEGWFSDASVLNRSEDDTNTDPKTGPAEIKNNKKTIYTFPIGETGAPLAYLEFEFKTPPSARAYVMILGGLLTRRLAEHLKDDNSSQRIENSDSRLGALRHFHQLAIETGNPTALFNEIVSAIVDLAPVSFCRLLFANPSQKYLKTAAMAQKRNLPWKIKYDSVVQLTAIERHQNALESGNVTIFDQSDPVKKLADDEASKSMPAGIKCGVLIPLMMDRKTAGLLVVGDCRSAGRVSRFSESLPFLEAMAGMISLVLTWHKEKRESREGNKKLTLMRKNIKSEAKKSKPVSRLNSRINGPLASILAACEYLKSGIDPETEKVDKLLDTIERNASQIHEITSSFES